jgi:hypothetical protein
MEILRRAKCRCCEREFTFIAVDLIEKDARLFCSICYGQSYTNCAAGVHCNLHTNPKDDLGCDCTETTVGSTR